MDAVTYLGVQLENMWSLADSATQDLEDDTLMQLPPGTVSPVGVIWLHMVNGEDGFVSLLGGGDPIWQSAGWNARFNLEKAPDFGEDWTQYQQAALSVELLQAYMLAVRERTRAFLATITNDSLDETVKFFTEADPKASVWALLIGHSLLHTGEIAAIKGVLGGKGLPF